MRVLREMERDGDFPTLEIAVWEEAFPGVVAGITRAAPQADFGLATVPSAWTLLERYESLAAQLGFDSVATVRQVHGSRVVCLESHVCGWRSLGPADGLLCTCAGVLLAATAADCVPIYLLHPPSRLIGLLHAGWRGIAAGVLEEGIASATRAIGAPAAALHVHFGPAICGECYKVGPEVARALGIAPTPGRGSPGPGSLQRLDLRAVLSDRAARLGVGADRVSRSAWCTRCAAIPLHSHRGSAGNAGRMAAFLGWSRL